MPSAALLTWIGKRREQLDEIEAAHASVGGSERGRRRATSQINAAYVALLSSQFQGYCRDLHTEAAQQLAGPVPSKVQQIFLSALTSNRKLDGGNPNAGNIGNDFKQLGMVTKFWDDVAEHGLFEERLKTDLDLCMVWRNAIAHQDFTKQELKGKTSVILKDVRAWRRSLERLAPIFDEVVRAHLHQVLDASPW